MNISLNPEAPLANLYRWARALATEESARPEEALALSQAGAAVFASEEGGSAGSRPTPAERRRDRVRRAVIAALRHQALMTRRAWMARSGPATDGDPEVRTLLQQATALAEAALQLHREGDLGRSETEYVVRFLRATAGIAGTPPRKPLPAVPPVPAASHGPAPAAGAERPAESPAAPLTAPEAPAATGSAPSAARSGVEAPRPPAGTPAAPAATKTADIFVIGLPPEPLPEEEPQKAPRRRASRPRAAPPYTEAKTVAGPRPRSALVAVLAIIAVIGFAAGVMTAPRLLGRGERPAKIEEPAAVAPPAISPAAVAPPVPSVAPKVVPSPAPAPTTRLPARPAARPTARPAPRETPRVNLKPAPGQVLLVLRSDPSGAQVYVGGVLQGTTPIRVPARPGSVVAVMMRRGSRVWRGIVQVGPAREQVVSVKLPQPPPAVAQAPPKPSPTAAAAPAPSPSPTVVNVRAHHDSLMQKGVELYRAGWYGPAIARFKQAIAVTPTPRAYLWLGRAAIKAGRYTEARRALERAVTLGPGTDAAREAQLLLHRLRLAERGT